ncbi:hypothetical protein FNJ88_07155 [Chryseobacterium sp. SNU WT5]|uniref:hypothetical protein n=1 Tax=Chryseobacterium sp. SNU WT5 TaxID=2594269 RepID=UPI00118133DB|nr:hypothetical protein [Chryseobacterium sp. SNU WT5]QDP85352.1 hypothetical protein FNJ88_07155 [Chryseobacterium sp. SNU WT5]
MKNFLLTMLLLASASLFAQTTFEKVMTEKIAKINQMKTPEDFSALANDFTRIADKEKTQWLPYYYAAYSTIEKGRTLMRTGQLSELDAIAAEAQKSVDKATDLSKDNAEILILQKMIHSLKMMVDPQARFMSEGMLAADALTKAEKLDPENPRITLLRAEDTYYTPEQFGGSKSKGLELMQKSVDQFKVYQSKTPLDPNWGKSEADYFLSTKP